MIIWKIGYTLDFGIISLIPRLGVPRFTKTPRWWILTLNKYQNWEVEQPNFFQNNA